MYYAWLKRVCVFTLLIIFLKQIFFIQETHTFSIDENVWIKNLGSAINFVKIIPTEGV